MKRCLVTVAIVALCFATLRADLSFTQTITIEGAAAVAAGAANQPMTMLTRIKGTKLRGDVEGAGMKVSTIMDLATKEMTVLNHEDKTAQVITPDKAAATPMPDVNVQVSFKATGQKRAIDGVEADEHALKLTLAMADVVGAQIPENAAAMLKDVRFVLTGSIWVTQQGAGAAEYMTFQKAAQAANLPSMLAGLFGTQKTGGGLDKMMAALSEAPGLPYLTEMTMAIEGTGPMVEMMKQVSGMKMIQKTTAVSTDALPDDLFTIPADYTVKK